MCAHTGPSMIIQMRSHVSCAVLHLIALNQQPTLEIAPYWHVLVIKIAIANTECLPHTRYSTEFFTFVNSSHLHSHHEVGALFLPKEQRLNPVPRFMQLMRQ